MREALERLESVLGQHGGKIAPCGLILPEDLPTDTLEAIATALCALDRQRRWCWGDWWLSGEHRHGDRTALVEAEDWAGPAYQTLCNYGTTCKAFAQISRRREKLTFTHHTLVSRLPAAEADRILADAEAQHRSTREVEEAVKSYFRDRVTPNGGNETQQPSGRDQPDQDDDDRRVMTRLQPVFRRGEPRTVTLRGPITTQHGDQDDAIRPLTSSHTAIEQVVNAIRTALSNPQLPPQGAMAAIAAAVDQSLPQATNHLLRPKLELLQQLLGGLADIVESAA